jgi:phospholipid/cholesterol/gamma-HCH transport system substrate-binding protein
MKNQTLTVGVFALLGIALIYTTYSALTQSGTFSQRQGYTLEAEFRDLMLLRVGDDIRMAGVRIGAVERVALRGNTAVAFMRIEESNQIPVDSVVTIAMSGLLGTNYLSVTLGEASTFYQPGDLMKSVPGTDVNTVLGEIANLGGGIEEFLGDLGVFFGGDGEDNILASLGTFFKDNKATVAETLANVRDITAKINEGEGTLARLLNDPSLFDEVLQLATDLRRVGTEAEELLGEVRTVVAAVRSGEGAAGRLLFDEGMADQLTTLVGNLEAFSDKLNNPDSTVGRLIGDDALLRDFQVLMQKANQTLDGLSDGAPISALGAAATALF